MTSKQQSLITLLLLPVVGIFIALLGAELVVRLFEFFPTKQPTWSDRPKFYFQHELATTLQDYHYPPKTPGTFRIAVIGDSFSFAPFMQFTDAFPKVLERMLNLNDQAPLVEVVNYGVPAYSTSHEVDVARQAAKEGADLLVLQFTLNDPELKPIRPTGITEFTTWGPLVVKGWKKELFGYWHTLKLVAERLHNARTNREYIKHFLNLYTNPRTYSVFADSVRRINRIAHKNKIPLVGVVFPLYGTPLDESYPFFPCHEKIAELLKELNIPMRDLFSIYKGIPLDRLQVIPGEDRHPNEIGHRMAGEAIYDFLAESNFVPKESIIIKKSSQRHNIYPR
jgi:lysophospholipase L1-like esterase